VAVANNKLGSSAAEGEGAQWWYSRTELEKALKAGGCVVCVALALYERKNIHSFLYEGMMFPEVRDQFLDSAGFCARHFNIAKQVEEESWQAGGIGMAILCHELIRRELRDLSEVPERNTSRKRIRSRLVELHPPGSSCMFCKNNEDKEQVFVDLLGEVEGEEVFHRALEQNGLCAWHGQLTLARWKKEDARNWLAEILRKHMGDLMEDLQALIRKRGWEHRAEPAGAERDSVNRARQLLLGTTLMRT
jgi:hypothetical protein